MYRQEEQPAEGAEGAEGAEEAKPGEDQCHPNAYNRRLRATQSPNDDNCRPPLTKIVPDPLSHCKNERSSADSLFHKGNAKLCLFHFGHHLVLVYTQEAWSGLSSCCGHSWR